MQKIMMKLKEGGFTKSTRHLKWASNFVLVRKKTRDIKLLMEFRDLDIVT